MENTQPNDINKPLPKQEQMIRDWWRTSIIDMKPGHIAFRGKSIVDLIGNASFTQMIWLMLRGQLPSNGQAQLLEAALLAGVDHGPQAPSIAAARMAATCGVSLNNVLATGVNMLGDIHGGAGEQCAQLYLDIEKRLKDNSANEESDALELEKATHQVLDDWSAKHGKIVPGFGHRFHKPVDPRALPLMRCVRKAAKAGVVESLFADIGEAVQKAIGQRRGNRPIAMNIDGATAVIFCALGFPPPLSRGLFCLSRSVGILAHGWEQMQQGGRNKGPMPTSFLPTYEKGKS